MKILLKTVMIASLFGGLTLFNSCKKDTKNDPDESGVFSQQAKDVDDASTGSDMTVDDAENFLSASSMSGFKTTSIPGLCNASVDTSNIATGLVVITYTGTSCDGLRTRSGSISLQIQNYPTVRWKDAGALLTITYNNFKVTNNYSGKSVTLNGNHQITNVSGGLVKHIGNSPNPSTIVRKIRSNDMILTFDDGTQRTWSVAKTRTWTGSAGIATGLNISGDTTINGISNIAVWGINRKGNTFSTAITTPISVNSTCGWYAPTAGVKVHYFSNRNATVTFGTDASGNVVSSGCPQYFRINWTSLSGVAKTYVGHY